MKTITKCLFLVILFSFSAGFSQELVVKYLHAGSRAAIINQQQLCDAKHVSDVITHLKPRLAKGMVIQNVKVSGLIAGRMVTSEAVGDELSKEQRDLLQAAGLGAEVVFDVVSEHNGKTSQAEYAVTPGPAVEASFPGGQEELTRYILQNLKQNVAAEVIEKKHNNLAVAFTVDENGNIVAPRINVKSQDAQIDQAVLEAVKAMPRWTPATTRAGDTVRQNIIFTIGGKQAEKKAGGSSGSGC